MEMKEWEARAGARLVGRTVTGVRYLNDEELEMTGWTSRSLVIFFDDGSYLFPSTDDEGNGPGALFTSHEDLSIIPVIWR